MAKELTDLTTIDLFSDDKRPGRPKTSPHPRNIQIKLCLLYTSPSPRDGLPPRMPSSA